MNRSPAGRRARRLSGLTGTGSAPTVLPWRASAGQWGNVVPHDLWVTHETIYDFDRTVDGLEVRARLRPIDDDAQSVLEFDVLCHPRPADRSHGKDRSGAPVDRLHLQGPLRRVEVRGQTRLRWTPDATVSRRSDPPTDGAGPAQPWARTGGAIWTWARKALPDSNPGPDDIAAFLDMIQSDFTFDPAAGSGTTPVPAFFRARRGVCQDYARLAAGCLQARGIPVRMVLGYLVRNPGGEPRFEEGQPHAWLSAWNDDAGWVDLDPTTGFVPPSHHVTLRRGRRLRDVQPVSGRLIAAPRTTQRLTVRVTIVKDATT